jgi:hypothetical protein
VISQVKLIAEPWDLGPGGYQVGNFPVLWTEWNGKYGVRHAGQGWLRAPGRGLAGHFRLAGRSRGLVAAGAPATGFLPGPEAGWRPLTTEAEAFGSLGRREQFERLVGVVDLLGAGASRCRSRG